MSDLDPTGPSQPTPQQGYNAPGNAATNTPAEASAATAQRNDTSAPVDQRIPTEQTSSISEATPTSQARGIRGAGPGEEARGETEASVGRGQELEGEQMAAPGEGEVSSAVERKPGATGGEEDLSSDLDRKKAEQAPAREAVKEERREEVDVAGVLGQRGGPASSVD